jgi:hypothetical protein
MLRASALLIPISLSYSNTKKQHHPKRFVNHGDLSVTKKSGLIVAKRTILRENV